jgi:hypothetical protein
MMVTRYTPRVSTSRDDDVDEGDDVSHFPLKMTLIKTTLKREESSIGGEKKKNEARERRFQQ